MVTYCTANIFENIFKRYFLKILILYDNYFAEIIKTKYIIEGDDTLIKN